ncbi:hypothetical protein FGB62_182g04 [Gracilaria domingensis]|nr:hypothetical protein FGB62_182g04 [Gracilaria domingensis]
MHRSARKDALPLEGTRSLVLRARRYIAVATNTRDVSPKSYSPLNQAVVLQTLVYDDPVVPKPYASNKKVYGGFECLRNPFFGHGKYDSGDDHNRNHFLYKKTLSPRHLNRQLLGCMRLIETYLSEPMAYLGPHKSVLDILVLWENHQLMPDFKDTHIGNAVNKPLLKAAKSGNLDEVMLKLAGSRQRAKQVSQDLQESHTKKRSSAAKTDTQSPEPKRRKVRDFSKTSAELRNNPSDDPKTPISVKLENRKGEDVILSMKQEFKEKEKTWLKEMEELKSELEKLRAEKESKHFGTRGLSKSRVHPNLEYLSKEELYNMKVAIEKRLQNMS